MAEGSATEVYFYHLERRTLDDVLAAWLAPGPTDLSPDGRARLRDRLGSTPQRHRPWLLPGAWPVRRAVAPIATSAASLPS